MTANRSHRTRLARALAAMSDLSYQAALNVVTQAAEAGRLPSTMSSSGMRIALDKLLAQVGSPFPDDATSMEPRYYRLAEVIGSKWERDVAGRVARARAAEPATVDLKGVRDFTDWWEDDDFESGTDWFRRVVIAGVRQDVEFECPYPHGRGLVPLDEALHRRDSTGDLNSYEDDLTAIVAAEPRDIDAWAHLGHLYFGMAGGDENIIMTPWPKAAEVRSFLRIALGYYQTAVAVGELSLPDPYPGLLTWGWLYNRPFFRGLHGMALALWRLRRMRAAEATLLNMLWLNPNDNQGARDMLDQVRAGTRWEDAKEL